MKVEVAAMMCGMGWWVVGMADNKVSKWGKKKCNELVQEKNMIRVIIVTISTVTREMRKQIRESTPVFLLPVQNGSVRRR